MILATQVSVASVYLAKLVVAGFLILFTQAFLLISTFPCRDNRLGYTGMVCFSIDYRSTIESFVTNSEFRYAHRHVRTEPRSLNEHTNYFVLGSEYGLRGEFFLDIYSLVKRESIILIVLVR